MRVIKYRPKYWMIILLAVGMLLDGIVLGQAIITHDWTAAVGSLVFAYNMLMNILAFIAASYVTTTHGVPADVGPNTKATTLKEEA